MLNRVTVFQGRIAKAQKLRAHLGAAAPFALLVAIIVLLIRIPENADVAWQMWIGRQLLDGARLYRDVVEINPPLWFWLAVPIVKLADLLRVNGSAVLVVFLGLCAAVSLALSPPRWRLPMVLAFFLAGISATGQREQFTLITVTPYVLLCAARAEGGRMSLGKAVAIGAWTAIGLALKPHFALVPIALGIWVVVRTRKVHPETLAIVGIGVAYLLAVLLIIPDYLATVQFAARYYNSYNVGPLSLLLGDAAIISLLALGGFLMVKRDDETTALLVAAAAFLLAYVIQQKGFRYQGLPVIGLLCIAALGNLRLRFTAVPLFLALIFTGATTMRQASVPDPHAMAATADLPAGSRVLILSPYVRAAWPMVEERHFGWESNYMFLWMHSDQELTARIANAEIQRLPERILVDDRLNARLDLSGYGKGQTFGHFAPFTRLRSKR